MKYVITVLSVLLVLSLCLLGFNSFKYSIINDKTKDINSKIKEIDNNILEMDKYLEENKNTYDEFIKNNKTKVEVYEKWLRMQKDVEEAL